MVGLNHRENLLIQKLLEFFLSHSPRAGGLGKGRINLSPKQEMVYYTVASVKDLTSLIVPHFDIYKLIGKGLYKALLKVSKLNKLWVITNYTLPIL
jgi:hypothetical protein